MAYSGPTYFDLVKKSSYFELVKAGTKEEDNDEDDDAAYDRGRALFKKEFDAIPRAVINRRDDHGRTALAYCMAVDAGNNSLMAGMLLDAGAKMPTLDLHG